MNVRLGVLLVALCIGVPAVADIKIVARAVETSTAYMNVPVSDNSRLSFKTCDDCEFIEVRLTPATQYFMRGQALVFADFRKQFNSLRRSNEDYVLVTFDAETNAVTSVRVAE
jgi:hypothetical protein